ncbi:hypothetical protein HAX54_008318 [Datura stramonium]|uniref:Uncharacterized protein n=1 Tax=Datura stramonium TaxID=4076 RepID=A0ABS8TEQ1_DATST|nr:hypothetical protein [Datura stramonium]
MVRLVQIWPEKTKRVVAGAGSAATREKGREGEWEKAAGGRGEEEGLATLRRFSSGEDGDFGGPAVLFRWRSYGGYGVRRRGCSWLPSELMVGVWWLAERGREEEGGCGASEMREKK